MTVVTMKKLTKVSPITKDTVKELKKLTKTRMAIGRKILKRVHYIADFLANLNNELGVQPRIGEYEGSDDHEEKAACFNVEHSSKDDYFEWCCNLGLIIIDEDGNERSFECDFPARWVHENFEEEVLVGKKRFDAVEKEAKLAFSQQDELRKSALKKLTVEEKKALGLK